MTANATTLDEIDVGALPASLTTEQAAHLLGISRIGLWGMASDGTAPVPFFRAGRAIRWPTKPILRLLGLDQSDPGAADPSAEGAPRDDASHAGPAAGS